jgi:bifunctional DNase/RNase
MKNALDALEAKVISVVITELKDNTYYAKLHLLYHDAEITVDTRPSDAIALALRTDSPIFVAEEVMQRQLADEDIARWLENLRPEDFGKADA